MSHEGDQPIERRRTRLSPVGRDVLDALERSSEAFGPPFEEARARLESLPPSERREVVALFGALAPDVADRQQKEVQSGAFAASAAEAIRKAQERERAAGRPVDPNITLGDALEILGR